MSEVPLPSECRVVFDLDDTLYQERDFVYSGFQAVVDFIHEQSGNASYEKLVSLYESCETDVFQIILDEQSVQISKAALIRVYREHSPQLRLRPTVKQLLGNLMRNGHPLGIVTDGRSLTQWNKIRALGLEKWAKEIAISEEIGAEKPEPVGFLEMEQRLKGGPFVYIGDNPAKDFVAPNQLGWTTICLRAKATNIKSQDFEDLPREYLPKYLINQLA